MRKYRPDILKAEYCRECMRTVNMVKVQLDGKTFYVCAGMRSENYIGCGHRIEIKDGGGAESV